LPAVINLFCLITCSVGLSSTDFGKVFSFFFWLQEPEMCDKWSSF
jgi:hypothetical protein